MINMIFNFLFDYCDLESINVYYQLVDEEYLVDGKIMSRYLVIYFWDNVRMLM